MFTKLRIFTLACVAAVAVLTASVARAEEADATADHSHHVGFFEEHYVLTELIVVPIFAVLIAAAMASNMTTQTIRTDHWDFWKRPLGSSYTHVPVPKEPSSPSEIKNTLIVLGVIYIVLRLTCLFGCFSSIFQFIGSLIDITFR